MRSRWPSSAIAAICLVTSASAQQADENTRHEIEQFVARFAEHYNKQDAAFLASEFAKDAVRVSSGAAAVGRQAIEEIFKTQFKIGFNHIDLTVDQVSPLGTDAAVTIGKYQATGQGQSGPLKVDGLWSEVEVREGGAWKIRVLTVVPNPPPPSNTPGPNR
jgi:uncharacterized protein (TIGR02246 family)